MQSGCPTASSAYTLASASDSDVRLSVVNIVHSFEHQQLLYDAESLTIGYVPIDLEGWCENTADLIVVVC